MSKPWMLLQRRNADALASATITKSAPAYVAPMLKAFRIYGVYGEAPIAVDGAESMLAGGAVIFYIEFNNPDGLEISNVRISTDESWTRNCLVDPELDVWWNQLTQHGRGYIWQLCAGSAALSASPLTPSFYFTYLDPEGGSYEVGPAVCSNGPLTVYSPSLTVLPTGWKWVGDTITVNGLPADMVYSVDVTQWGDEE